LLPSDVAFFFPKNFLFRIRTKVKSCRLGDSVEGMLERGLEKKIRLGKICEGGIEPLDLRPFWGRRIERRKEETAIKKEATKIWKREKG
jgi:hypothetical protein